MITWARLGYEVHAFEPMTSSIDYLQKRAKRLNINKNNLVIHHVAATNEAMGYMTVKYNPKNETERSRKARVDAELDGNTLDLLSVDVQGAEWAVLQGSMKLLQTPGKVRSLWVELFPCGKNNLQMLKKTGLARIRAVRHGAAG